MIRTSDNAVVATITVGDGPRGVAITPGGGRVYVSNQLSDNVSVIRTSDNTVVATIAVGDHPEDIVASPDGARVYVMNADDGSISVIRTSDNSVVATPVFADDASAMTIASDGSEIFLNYSNTTGGGFLGTLSTTGTAAIRTTDFSVRGEFDGGVLGGLRDVALTRDGTRAFLAAKPTLSTYGFLYVIGTSSLAITASVQLGGLTGPTAVALTPNDAYAYVAEPAILGFGTCNAGRILIIPTATVTIETSVPVGCSPVDVAFTPDGATAYVTDRTVSQAQDGHVSVINTSTKTVSGTGIAVGSAPIGLAIGFVPTSAQLMDELDDVVTGLGLSNGIQGSLLTKLASALSAIDAGKTRAACGALSDFVSQVSAQSGKKIDAASAAQLIALANQVREIIGC